MKKTITDTSSAKVDRELTKLRSEFGSSALGRVLTLIIVVKSQEEVDEALEASSAASETHPSRVIVVLREEDDEPKLDAELRIGSDAGASEVAILHAHGGAANNLETLVTPLLLSDSPVVVWWYGEVPEAPGRTPLGRLAKRRITSVPVAEGDAASSLRWLRDSYTPGDTDTSWASTTLWRNYLAAAMDEFPDAQPKSVTVWGTRHGAEALMLGAWLGLRLDVPVQLIDADEWLISGVAITLKDGSEIAIHRIANEEHAILSRPGRHDQEIGLSPRTMDTMLVEELQEMSPDLAYEDVLLHGLYHVGV